MDPEPPQLLQSVLVAQTEGEWWQCSDVFFCLPGRRILPAMQASLSAIQRTCLPAKAAAARYKFDGWCAVNIPEEFSTIPFRLPSGDGTFLHTEYVWIHQSGLMIYGPNKAARHWLEVFLRSKLPSRAAIELDVHNGFMLNTYLQEWGRTFTTRDFETVEWVDPPGETFPYPSSSSISQASSRIVSGWGWNDAGHASGTCMEAADIDNADIWLLQMMYPVVSEVATELQTLITEQTDATAASTESQRQIVDTHEQHGQFGFSVCRKLTG